MKLFKKIPLNLRLSLLAIIPIAGLLYFFYKSMKDDEARITQITLLNEKIKLIDYISDATEELQNERSASYTYTLTGAKDITLLSAQRIKTDLSLKELDKHLLPFDESYLSYTHLSQLPLQRTLINMKMSPEEMMDFYFHVIQNLLSYMPHEDALNYSGPLRNDLRTQKYLAHASVYLAMIRLEIYNALKQEKIPEDFYGKVKILRMNYNSEIAEFLTKGSPEAIRDYDLAFKGGDVMLTFNILDRLQKQDNSIPAPGPETWMVTSSSALAQLNDIKDRNLTVLKDKGETIHGQALGDRRVVVIIVVFLIGIALLISSAVLRSISSSLTQIKQAIVLFAQGRVITRLKAESKDVIGVVAESINQMDLGNEQIIKAANAIGNEDFSHQVPLRSSDDMLGAALVRMKEKLEVLSEAAKLKDWVVTGMTKLNDELKGEKDPSTLAKNIIEYLAEYSNSQVGAMYLLEDNNELKLYGSYALSDKINKQFVKLGEGLIGQAALEKRVLLLDNIPEDYLRISFAAGELKPKNILIIPILFDNSLKGVVELGSLQGFTSRELELLNLISLNIAIAVIASQNRKKVQELLDETQTQSVVLQSQQELLEKLNSELEERNSIIQGSEEELKTTNEVLEEKGQELEVKNRALNEKNEAVLQASRELKEKSEQLERTSQYKSEFLANMSHELRTPLNSILLLSQLLGDNDKENLDEEQVEYAKVVHNSGKNLLELIDDILDLSKIESGKMLVEPENASFADIKYDIESTFQPVSNKKNVHFEVNISPDLPPNIHTDKMRLEQVLKNLLSNAFKFTSKGKVTLEVMPVENLQDQPAYVSFKVSDTGIGIPEDKQQLIFEAFQQVDGSTRRQYGGTGLGLSISREIADVLGGEIRVESEINKGSSFTFFVPLIYIPRLEKGEQPHQSNPVVADYFSPSSKTYTVEEIPEEIPDDRNNISADDKLFLIVEDDTALAKLFLKYIHEKHHKAIVIVRGDKVQGFARKFSPAGILLDIKLPVLDGWEVLHRLKEDPYTRTIPVHINSVLNVKMESMRKKADRFSHKPLNISEIRGIVDQMMRSATSKKVLVQKSNNLNPDLLFHPLQTEGAEIVTAADPAATISLMGTEDPQCLVIDLSEGTEENYKVLEIIKENNVFNNVKVIAFTGKRLGNSELERIEEYNNFMRVTAVETFKEVYDETAQVLHLDSNSQQSGRHKQPLISNDSLEGKTILITDDDVRNIFALTKILERHKINVITATDGMETIKSLKVNTQIDLILMDMMMPEMDGYEAMQKIRDMKTYNKLPIIAVTAKAMHGDREKCIAAGASDYITKPVEVDQLMSMLKMWIN